VESNTALIFPDFSTTPPGTSVRFSGGRNPERKLEAHFLPVKPGDSKRRFDHIPPHVKDLANAPSHLFKTGFFDLPKPGDPSTVVQVGKKRRFLPVRRDIRGGESSKPAQAGKRRRNSVDSDHGRSPSLSSSDHLLRGPEVGGIRERVSSTSAGEQRQESSDLRESDSKRQRVLYWAHWGFKPHWQ